MTVESLIKSFAAIIESHETKRRHIASKRVFKKILLLRGHPN
ncbi:hypothetical protein NEOC65_001460 [Neochlamydia sp. AcF65]|nr:hypothetical protein [Neochlamydia sp. AcF65]